MLSSRSFHCLTLDSFLDWIPMLTYFRLFFDICLFRQPAENVPKSETLLLLTLGTAIASGAFNALADYRMSGALFMAAIQVLLFALMIWIALRLRGHQERWIQTTTGIYGAITILQIITIPLSSWHSRLMSPDISGVVLTLPLLTIAGISIWTLAVTASVLRQAMQIPISAAVLIIIGSQALLLMIVFKVITSVGY